MQVANIINTEGEDISLLINEAATANGLDPVHLLALIMAESGRTPNPKAERWGRETGVAQAAIAAGDTHTLMSIIGRAGADISFGYSQRIVMYHDQGDRSHSLNNVLAVRDYVFSHPEEDIMAAARRFSHGIQQSLDGTALGGLIVYNSGADRRNDPVWMKQWAGNVASYQRALEEAEQYAVVGPTPEEEWTNVYNVLFGISRELASFSKQLADVLEITKRLRG
jgi:hypothetical protein